jgi:hypothetical protein
LTLVRQPVRWGRPSVAGQRRVAAGGPGLSWAAFEETLALAGSLFLFGGFVLLPFLPRSAGFVLIAGLAVRIAAHLATGVRRYRAAMSHPWPPVAPLVDDDW